MAFSPSAPGTVLEELEAANRLLIQQVFKPISNEYRISIPAPGVWMPATILLTLAVAGLTACWLPARRAVGIRPAEALSAD